MRWRRCLDVTVRLGERALRRRLWRDKQLAGAFDVVGPNRAGEQAVVADAMEAAGERVLVGLGGNHRWRWDDLTLFRTT